MLLFKNCFEQMNQIIYVVITCDMSNMMRWILLGPNQNLTSEFSHNFFENCVSLGTQFMMQSFHIRYNPVPCCQCHVRSCWDTFVIRLSPLRSCFIKRREVKFKVREIKRIWKLRKKSDQTPLNSLLFCPEPTQVSLMLFINTILFGVWWKVNKK